jgi:formate/nitrite transporter
MCSTGVAKIMGPGISKLVSGAVFPVGLIAIVITGAELFTGDCMLVSIGALMRKAGWKDVGRVWILVYMGNLIGSLFLAYLMVVGPFKTGGASGFGINEFGKNAVDIAVSKTLTYKAVGAIGIWSCFWKAIGCNILVNIAILLALASDDIIGKFFGIWFPIMAFVSSGFEHSVANMYFIPAGMMLLNPSVVAENGGLLASYGGISVADMWIWNLIPATIGNIVGGMIFVGFIYFYAFRKELPEERK